MEKIFPRSSAPRGVQVLTRNLIRQFRSDARLSDCCRRLHTENMDRNWDLLLRSKNSATAESFLAQSFWLEMDLYGLSNMSLPEKSCAAVFFACTKAYQNFEDASFAKQREAKIDRYIIADEVMREFLDDRSEKDVSFEPGLREALEISNRYLLERFIKLVNDFNPAEIKNQSGQNTSIRSALRIIAYFTTNLYGDAKYGILSSIGNIIFDPIHILSDQSVKTWFKDLQLFERPARIRNNLN